MRKAKAAPPPAISVEERKRRILIVDEIGQLENELALIKPKAKRVEVLKKEIQGWAESYPSEQPLMFEGERFAVQVSAKGNKRRISSMGKLFELLGKLKFLALCSFTLKAAEENLTAAQLNDVVVEELGVGERSVKAMQRALPFARPKAA